MVASSVSGRLTAWLLVLVNLIPLAGILWLDWSLFQIVALYWMENVIVGVINLLKMLVCAPDESHPMARRAGFARSGQRAHHAIKIFLLPFFTFHYGLFCLVHGVFVFVLLGKESMAAGRGLFPVIPAMTGKVLESGGLWALVALALSHVVSFVWHFLIGGEYRRTDVMTLMAAPYGRIVVLHVAILLGAFAIQALGSPLPMLLLLIAGKTGLDLIVHRKSHRNAAPPAA